MHYTTEVFSHGLTHKELQCTVKTVVMCSLISELNNIRTIKRVRIFTTPVMLVMGYINVQVTAATQLDLTAVKLYSFTLPQKMCASQNNMWNTVVFNPQFTVNVVNNWWDAADYSAHHWLQRRWQLHPHPLSLFGRETNEITHWPILFRSLSLAKPCWSCPPSSHWMPIGSKPHHRQLHSEAAV